MTMNKKEFLKDLKIKLNIDLLRITDGKPSEFLEDRLLERINEDKITEFENKNIEEKLDVNKTFSAYKSVIVIGQSYKSDYKEKVDFNKGLLSKTSWGKDYHYVLEDKMDGLIEEMSKRFGGNYKAYVDTGPLVDRNLAYTSGIGYYGKNCSIINEEYGSFIFIGYIITDLYIERDEVLEGDCKDCTRCLDYCPTNALESPYKLNPKKCISYLTQTKELIPYELRKSMGAKIYGCDTCQDVCPKNINVKLSTTDEFIPSKTKGYVDLDEILFMSNKEFKNKYGHMSGAWRGKNVLKRNAIIAIGNKKDKSYIPILEKLLLEESFIVRESAMWSLLTLDKKEGEKIINNYIDNNKNDCKSLKEYKKMKKYFSI